MAYGNALASVSWDQVVELRAGRRNLLVPSRIVVVTHLLAYWVKIQPLGRLLGDALDGGWVLSPQFDHRFRRPVVREPNEVRRILGALRASLREVEQGPPFREVRLFALEINLLIETLSHAADHGEAFVSALVEWESPPEDRGPERAPFAEILGPFR